MFFTSDHFLVSKSKDVECGLTGSVEGAVGLDIDKHEVVAHGRLAIVDVRVDPAR
jgi:hypothetical protein